MAPICIAGAHRSGTSMVARVLKECGVFLGAGRDLLPASEANRDGYWEHAALTKLNDDVLELLGGTWAAPPPLPEGWERRPDLSPLEERATTIVAPLQHEPRWGWKDPRNSLTLPFWRRVLGELDVVVCVRHPAEIVASLSARDGMDRAEASALCLTYMRLLEHAQGSGRRTVVLYDTFLDDPSGQVVRLADTLGLSPPPDQAALAVESVNQALRHHAKPAEDLPPGLLASYEKLRAEAAEGPTRAEGPASDEQLKAARMLLHETRERAYVLQDQLAETRTECDQALQAAARERERIVGALADGLHEAKRLIDALNEELREIKDTRFWRLATLWWRLAATFRGRRARSR